MGCRNAVQHRAVYKRANVCREEVDPVVKGGLHERDRMAAWGESRTNVKVAITTYWRSCRQFGPGQPVLATLPLGRVDTHSCRVCVSLACVSWNLDHLRHVTFHRVYGRACPSSTAHSELEYNICVDSGNRRVKGVSFLITDVRLPTATKWCIEVISNSTRQKSSWESLLGIGRFSPHHWFGPFMTQAEDIIAYLPSHVSMPQHQSRSLQIRVSCKLNHCHSASPQTKRPNDLHDLLGAPAKQQGSAYAINRRQMDTGCGFLDSRVNPLRLCFLDYSFLCQPSFS